MSDRGEESYMGQFTPWIANHLVDDEMNIPADFLFGSAYVQFRAKDVDNGKLTSMLLNSTLMTNFFLRLFMENSIRPEAHNEDPDDS